MAFEILPLGEYPVGIVAPVIAAVKDRLELANEDPEVVKRQIAGEIMKALRHGATEFPDETVLLPEPLRSAA